MEQRARVITPFVDDDPSDRPLVRVNRDSSSSTSSTSSTSFGIGGGELDPFAISKLLANDSLYCLLLLPLSNESKNGDNCWCCGCNGTFESYLGFSFYDLKKNSP